MTEDAPSTASDLSALRLRQRTAWLSGNRLSVEALMQSAGRTFSDVELLELIRAEVTLRNAIGDKANIQDYNQRFPQIIPSLEDLFATQQDVTPSDDGSLEVTKTHEGGESDPWSRNAVAVGDRIGPYQLLKKIGEGGMGAVYQARHTKLGKVVALKLLSSKLLVRPDTVARFEREMLAVGSVQHPNIVQAYDAGTLDGIHYLSMEYVHGQDLQSIVKTNGPMSIRDACTAIMGAARGLAAAHRQGVVHRDIKSSNLILTDDGQTKILDLGLAKLSAQSAQLDVDLTSAGQLLGTVDYMAPEQWDEAHTVDSRTDQYALGCTLFFLLVGRAPFATADYASVVRKMSAHVRSAPPDLNAARADVPEGLNKIYRRLMSKRPEDRYATTDDLVVAIEPFTKEAPQTPRTPDATTTKRRSTASRWLIPVGIGIVIALLTLVVPGLNHKQAGVDKPPSVDVVPAPGIAATVGSDQNTSRDVGPEFELGFDGEASGVDTPVVFDAKDGLTIEMWVTVENTRGLSYLASDLLSGRDGQYKGRALAIWDNQWVVQTPTGGGEPVIKSNVSINLLKSTHVAVVFDRYEIRLYVDGHLAGKTPLGTFEASHLAFSLGNANQTGAAAPSFRGVMRECRFSSDAIYHGDRFEPEEQLASTEKTIALYRADKGSGEVLEDRSANTKHSKIRGARWFDVSQNRLRGLLPRAQRLADGRYWQLRTVVPFQSSVLCWHPDGSKIACTADSVIHILDAETFEPIRFHAGHRARVEDAQFSPDGKWLASSSGDQTIRLWNLESGAAGPVIQAHIGPVRSIAWSPDSKHFVSGGFWFDSTIKVWNLDGTLKTSWRGHEANEFVYWSPDGQWIAACANTVKIWNSQGVPRAELKIPDARIVSGIFSPDSKSYLGGVLKSGHGYLARWDTSNWELVESWPEEKRPHWANKFSWSQDGSKVYSIWQNANLLCWDVAQNRWMWEIPSRNMQSFALKSDGKQLLINPLDRKMVVYDTDSRAITRERGFNSMNLSNYYVQVQSRVADAGFVLLNPLEFRLISNEGQERRTAQATPFTARASLSPDGRWLALAGDDFVVRLWTDDATPGPTLRGHSDSINSMTWSPGGDALLTGSNDGTVRIWKGTANSDPWLTFPSGTQVRRVSWSPQGKNVVVESLRGGSTKLEVYTPDGKLQRELSAFDPIEDMAWHPSGELVAVCVKETSRISIINARTGEAALDVKPDGYRPYRLVWSPGGERLVVTPRDESREIRLYSKDGHPGPVAMTTPFSQICWLDDDTTFCNCGATGIDVYRLAAVNGKTNCEYVKSYNFESRPWQSHLDAVHRRLHYWNGSSYMHGMVGEILTVELETGKVLHSLLPIDTGPAVRVDSSGRLNTNDPDVEKLFVYIVAEPDGAITIHKPSDFRKLVRW